MHQHRIAFSSVLILFLVATASPTSVEQNWTNYVRIGAYGLARNSADKIVADAQATGVFGIEVDNDIPGRYEVFSIRKQSWRLFGLSQKKHTRWEIMSLCTLPEQNALPPTAIR